MRIAVWTSALLVAAACTSKPTLVPQAAPAKPPSAASAKQPVSAPRPVLWVVNGQVLGRATDLQSLVPGADSLDTRLIESVEVLKGGAAVAEFGEAAAEGVIVIRTRQVLKRRD